jgi:hypothetical protein
VDQVIFVLTGRCGLAIIYLLGYCFELLKYDYTSWSVHMKQYRSDSAEGIVLMLLMRQQILCNRNR